MKIIERGTLPEERVWRGRCVSCRTLFECLRSEGTYQPALDQRDEPSLRVNCPVCTRICYGSEVK
jgi:hypothetical protein